MQQACVVGAAGVVITEGQIFKTDLPYPHAKYTYYEDSLRPALSIKSCMKMGTVGHTDGTGDWAKLAQVVSIAYGASGVCSVFELFQL